MAQAAVSYLIYECCLLNSLPVGQAVSGLCAAYPSYLAGR